ncbi:LOW QUALITY PROTEIN: olfactory guanylyl cyclase GC-D-like [Myotis lucifugus]|uniref:LOW QUALITY PROTEIN: olfactory guanylyl cyclase GC-D-like n=1 Tax=Myotis lucifugus TaxID=59463 RepID=UPI000CCC5A0E|nr:LOW QUALITY PROTEIN: olfactory guanylyl cyclase GC-D-like [Myotis lucifugus]
MLETLLFSSFPGPQEGLYPEGWHWRRPHGKTCPGLRGSPFICPRRAPSLPLFSVVLWGALLWAGSLPSRAWGVGTFTLGVLGPWDCDPIFAQALPRVAAQLAMDRANQDSSLMLGSRLASVVLPTGCDTPRALATFLVHQNTVAAFVGPVNPGYCPAAALLAQGWGKTLFSWACEAPLGGGELVPTLPSAAHVLLSVMKYFGWARVAIVSSHQDIWVATARQVAVTLRTHGLPVVLVAALGPGEQGATEILKQLRGVDGLKVVVLCMHSALLGGSEQMALLRQAWAQGLADGRLVFLPYDTMLFALPYRNRSYPALGLGGPLREVYDAVLSVTLESGPVDEAIKAAGASEEGAAHLEPEQSALSSPPGTQPPGSFLALALACVVVLAGGALTCLIRLGVRQLQLVRGPHGILLTARELAFIHPPLSSQRLHTDRDSASESRSAADGGSLRSVAQGSARSPQEPTNVALYQGEWVRLKTFEAGMAPELRPSCLRLLRKMRELRHENVATCLGFFLAPGVSALVLEHCARGSLEDLLRNEALRLDWTFQASLLLDLIRGVRYLHHQHFPHGRLKSRNCVVDERFVLKVTDHGYAGLLDARRAPRPRPAPEDLLWTAPELLRGPRGPGRGTLRGDVFSVGIILQEVLTRGPPYGSSGLSAEEIIRKVASPPPLCRPLVSPDHGPPECIQLMEQCWEEAPEDRPSLDQIYTQFKSINHGKKTSVADSMLRRLEKYSQNLEGLIQARTEELELERQKTERLLSQMLPPSVAEALKTGATVEPEYFDHVTIYFSDIVGFTTISALSEPMEVVGLLNDLYTLFDAVLGNHDVYKVETIGDAYMVASGLPRRNGSRHAAEIANMALDILSSVGDFRMRHAPDVPICIRAGLHSGPCVAGVVGLTMPRYCLFGDTVNTASRMESTGLPYRIHVSGSTVQTLLSLDEGYKIDIRGQTELKGKGVEETYWLTGKAGFPRPLPTPLDIKPEDPWKDLINQEIRAAFAKVRQCSAGPSSSGKA